MRQKKPIKKEETRSEVHTTIPTIGQSILGGVLQGFTFGSGSAIAHNIFRTPIQIEKKKDCKDILQVYESLCKDKMSYSLEENNQCKQLWEEMKEYC